MASKRLNLSWQEIEKDCQSIARKLKNKNFDLIVAITKGGLPLATILSNKYLNKAHIITLQLEEIKVETKAGYSAQKVKLISPLNIYPIKNKHVLIVDDVSDTGSTLRKAVKLVKAEQPQSLTTATLHYKPRTHTQPDIFARKIDNHTWIVYPWE
jgi:hypoxanthine phosphoribosyltransferase